MSNLTKIENESSNKKCKFHPLDIENCDENETCVLNKCIKTTTYYHHSV